jgi:hypothetical protein
MKKYRRYFLYFHLVLSAAMSIAFANKESGQAQSAFESKSNILWNAIKIIANIL